MSVCSDYYYYTVIVIYSVIVYLNIDKDSQVAITTDK